MRATSAAALLCCALPLVACGTSGRDKQARKASQQVAGAVAALQQDLLTRNWDDICNRLFSSAARAQAGGSSCPGFVRRGAAGVRGASIAVRSIEVTGAKASAEVMTAAEGQAPVPETIELVSEQGRFKIDSLAR